MSSFLFYDPNPHHHSSTCHPNFHHHSSTCHPNFHHHSSTCDPNVLFLQCLECLCECVSSDIHIQKIVCVCCSNTSKIIEKLQQRQQNVLIYLCKEHGDPNVNALLYHNVHDDVKFDFDGDWQFKCRLRLMEANYNSGDMRQTRDDVQKLKRIKEQVCNTLRPSINVQDQQEDASSDTSDEFAPSEETQ